MKAESDTISGALVFREARDERELRALFELRYRVYRAGRLSRLIRANSYAMDIDAWDSRSRHFGMFPAGSGSKQPVGYMRVVEGSRIVENRLLEAMAADFPEVTGCLTAQPAEAYPLMAYAPHRELLRQYHEDLALAGERLCEACRFALNEQARSPRVARHMVESALAIYFFHYRYEHAMWACDASKAAFYGIYGLRPAEGIPVSDFLGMGVDSCVLFGSPERVTGPARKRIERMAAEYDATRAITIKTAPRQSSDLEGTTAEPESGVVRKWAAGRR